MPCALEGAKEIKSIINWKAVMYCFIIKLGNPWTYSESDWSRQLRKLTFMDLKSQGNNRTKASKLVNLFMCYVLVEYVTTV
jgi:hypothetical protein